MTHRTYSIRRYSRKLIYAQIAGMGAISGLRSTVAPALVSHYLTEDHLERPVNQVLGPINSPTVATLLKALAAGELIADKLPFIPPRTALPSLLVRTASGAFVGAILSIAHNDHPAIGAAIGGASAALATYAGYFLRTRLTSTLPVPDALAGALEDTLVVGGGNLLMNLTPDLF